MTTVLRYLPGGIVRAPAECADAGLHLFVLDGNVPPPHRCYLPPGHNYKWHRCYCGAGWTAKGWIRIGQPQSTPLLDEDENDVPLFRTGGPVTAFERVQLTRSLLHPSMHGWVDHDLEPDVPPAPTARADHPWLVWVGRGLAVAVLVVVVIGATGPW